MIELPGKLVKVMMCAYANITQDHHDKYSASCLKSEEIIPFESEIISTTDFSEFGELVEHDNHDIIKFNRMPSGFIMVVQTSSGSQTEVYQTYIDVKLEILREMKEFKDVSLSTLNYCLYKCNEEELDYTGGKRGVYLINGIEMDYAGIASIIFHLRHLKESQNLGSPLFNNIREGHWFLDFILQRFKDHIDTHFLVDILEDIFEHIKKLPNKSKPHYFAKTI